jgi:transposase
MAHRKRALLEPTDDWLQLQFQLDWPEQHRYELIRPVVVFGAPPVERAQQTGISARTVYRRVERFDQVGKQSLFEAEPVEDKRALPPTIRRAILELKAEYPAFRPNELATICDIRFNRGPSPHTIKKVLAEAPLPVVATRRFPPYGEIDDPVERRAAIVRLHAEGWNIASIAGYLQTNRPRVYKVLKRWIEEGVQGLEDKPPIPHQPATKTTLWAMNAARKLQRNPELGAFRLHVALKQLGITLSARTCGRILVRNRKLYELRGPEANPREPKAMPFKAAYRHQYWTVDIRYLDHQLGGAWVHDYNTQEHWAHQKRQDGRRSPTDVLGWHTGKRFGEEDLARIFAPARFWRRVDQQGYVRFRNWRLYGERGLVGRPAVVWLTEEHLTLQYGEDPLAHYAVTHRRDRRQLATVISQVLYQTHFTSPQPLLPEIGLGYWQKAILRTRRRRRRRSPRESIQPPLLGLEETVAEH